MNKVSKLVFDQIRDIVYYKINSQLSGQTIGQIRNLLSSELISQIENRLVFQSKTQIYNQIKENQNE